MPQSEGMATLEPLRGQTLGMQAADAIRRLIATGQLAGGDHLIESRIAEQLGISRGSVRDALWLLRGEGLVRDEPRRGTFVAQLTANDVRDIYDLRIAVEIAAVRLIKQRPGTMHQPPVRVALGRPHALPMKLRKHRRRARPIEALVMKENSAIQTIDLF